MKKQKQPPAILLCYCVGIDVGKDTLHLCVSAIDADGKVSVKGSRQLPNRVPAFEVLEAWCAKHHKDMALPVRYLSGRRCGPTTSSTRSCTARLSTRSPSSS